MDIAQEHYLIFHGTLLLFCVFSKRKEQEKPPGVRKGKTTPYRLMEKESVSGGKYPVLLNKWGASSKKHSLSVQKKANYPIRPEKRILRYLSLSLAKKQPELVSAESLLYLHIC